MHNDIRINFELFNISFVILNTVFIFGTKETKNKKNKDTKTDKYTFQ